MTTDISVPAAERTLRLLELVLNHPAGLTPQDCLEALDVSRSSLFALLRTLKTLGYLEQAEERGSYRAGPRLKAWQRSAQFGPQDLLTAFYQEAVGLPTDETVLLVVPNRDELLVLAQIESTRRVRSVYETGGICERRDCPAALVLADPPAESVRQDGYALRSDSELIEIALPVCSDGHYPDAALMVTAPAFRQDADSLQACLPVLRELAARLSYRIGAPIYAPFQQEHRPVVGPAVPLDAKEIDAFLKGPWPARLACVRPDGVPHVVPVWQGWDGEAFYVVAWDGSLWGDYLLANPQLSLSVDEPWPPLRRVIVRGRAQPVEPDDLPGGLPAFLEGLSQRYLGQAARPDLQAQVARAFRVDAESVSGWRGLHKEGTRAG
jgi:DNA-binding IclR family transcriptional regulator